MDITVLHTEDCPNVEPLMAELNDLLADRSDVTITTSMVRSDDEAERLCFQGSPTILVDGRDLFPIPDGRVGPSCRIYTCDGPDRGFPSRERLADALAGAH